MPSDAELDAQLKVLLGTIVRRLTQGKSVSASVVQQLLRSKYADTYPEAYIAAKESFITETMKQLMDAKAAEETVAKKPATVKPKESSSESESEESSSADDDEEDSDADEESGDDEESDDFDSDEDDDDDDEESEEDGAPDAKKVKLETEAKVPAGGDANVAERCKAMASCLTKLHYHIRGPGAEETLEVYLEYLTEQFKSHGMDPVKYAKNDIKRYMVKREVELLQADGATMNLDKRNRAGRGLGAVELPRDTDAPPPNPSDANKAKWFLDDE